MKRWKTLFLLFVALWCQLIADIRPLNKDWKFQLGEFLEAKNKDFNDISWRKLNLPHDWAFEQGFSVDGAQRENGGYACGGIGWYRKRLVLSAGDLKGGKIFLDFDAAYMNSEVWCNGHYLGKCPYGYIPFDYEITPYVNEGENIIAVRIDNSLEPSARWYHGCGIYGNVQLRIHHQAYFEKDATFIHSANSQGEVFLWSVVKNINFGQSLILKAEICDAKGRRKATYKSGAVNVSQVDTFKLDMKVRQPKLWSPESPYLYQLNMYLCDAKGRKIDTQRIRIGFRDIRWDAENGFFLNGKQYKLHGVCDHLEGGPVGAQYTPQLLRWKLQLLKDMGCNAIRTAHNPQVPAFYELCDEMGFLVMDEVFDGWKRKADYDYGMQAFATCWERDLRTLIRRDRNHPSVFVYSVGNETHGPIGPDLVSVCHEEDSSRWVTSGSGGSAAMDILGMNGGSETKKFLDNYHPSGRAFVATENPHTWQVRGYYRSHTWYRDGYNEKSQQMMKIPHLTNKEIFTYDWISPDKRRNRKQIFNSSYDNATVRATARHILQVARDKNWFSGNFRWTGFDYLGEAGYVHGGWPFRAFQSGALDLAGFPKDLYYLYQSEWTNRDMVHILPHWSHPMMELGTAIPVWVYTTGDEVEVWHNGKSLGRKQKGRVWNELQCEFRVPWQPGTLEVVAYRKGKEIARAQQVTADAPSRLNVQVANQRLKNDGEDISILTIREEDRSGTLYPYGENRVYVAVKGAARVLSFENGSPVDTECNFNAMSRCCFFGLNRLFVQSVEESHEAPVSVVLAAICGDKKMKQSNKITISLVEKSLRGKLPRRDIAIYYTTDGSRPTRKSLRYEKPFPLVAAATVRAVVYDGHQQLMEMSEAFGPDEGLYWGKTEEPSAVTLGEQAEELQLTGCKVEKSKHAFHGRGYVVPMPGKGALAWYQENDGVEVKGTLSIRYQVPSKVKSFDMLLYNNQRRVMQISFEKKMNAEEGWQSLKVPVTIYSGANRFELKSEKAEGAIMIDEIHLE